MSIKSTIFHKNGEPGNKFLEWMKLQRSEEYDWSELSESQKADVRDYLMTGAAWILLTIGAAAMWDRDEEDGLKKMANRITDDFGGNVNFMEVTKNVVNLTQPVAIKKAYKFLESGVTTFWSGTFALAGYDEAAFTQQGNLRG